MHLYYNLDRGSDLRPYAVLRHRKASHTDHLLEARDRISGAIGMHRRHGAFVPGGHRLQHVESFLAAHLADDDPVRSHSECILDELALANFAAPLDIWRTCLKSPNMRLLQLQLGGVLDRDQTLFLGNKARQSIEECCLAGARATRDEYGYARPYGLREHLCHRRA